MSEKQSVRKPWKPFTSACRTGIGGSSHHSEMEPGAFFQHWHEKKKNSDSYDKLRLWRLYYMITILQVKSQMCGCLPQRFKAGL